MLMICMEYMTKTLNHKEACAHWQTAEAPVGLPCGSAQCKSCLNFLRAKLSIMCLTRLICILYFDADSGRASWRLLQR